LAEATADAWIGDFLPWGSFPDFSDEDYAKVPRHVPEGWQFELYAAPRVLISDGPRHQCCLPNGDGPEAEPLHTVKLNP